MLLRTLTPLASLAQMRMEMSNPYFASLVNVYACQIAAQEEAKAQVSRSSLPFNPFSSLLSPLFALLAVGHAP